MAQEQRQVVHVRGNSEESMNELFQVLTNTEAKKCTMRDRNLPRSFFISPQRPHPSHSREGSQDSTTFPHAPSQLQPNHSRSHSSPAQFLASHSLSVPTPHHSKQQSVDILDDPGWVAGQQHLHNFHQFSQQQQQQQQQQWGVTSPSKPSPHLTASPQPGSQLSPNPPPQQPLPVITPPQANPIIEGMLMPLPPGWEISITADDEIYFINHLNKTTSWFNPSIPKQQQGAGPVRLSQLAPDQRQMVHQRIAQSQAQLQQQHQQLQLQQQHQQLQAINCLSPAAGGGGGGAGLMAAGGRMGAASVSSQQQQQQHAASELIIRQQLQQLQMEKQKLQQQQEEILRKEKLLVQRNFGTSSHNAPLTSSAPNALGIIDENRLSTNQNQRTGSQENVLKDMIVPGDQLHSTPLQAQSTGVDPFLGQGQNADSHARQNSADSGLGGMGNSYSLPRTPEDLLSNVDEMDSSTVEGSRQQTKAPGSDFNMNDMAGMSMDISAPAVDAMDGQMGAMDGADDLIPSLQPDVLNSELLQEMDANSMLTWL